MVAGAGLLLQCIVGSPLPRASDTEQQCVCLMSTPVAQGFDRSRGGLERTSWMRGMGATRSQWFLCSHNMPADTMEAPS